MKLLVLLLLPCLSLSELSPGFANCRQFLLNNRPPQFTQWGNSVQEICQCIWNNNNNRPDYFYATLYNTDWRIPIYSAYVIRSPHVKREDPWYIEPQLDDAKAEACMGAKGRRIINNQAENDDYVGSPNVGYQKGHLYPVQHTNTYLSMLATSTLTNAAPQHSGFNGGKWRVHETAVITDLGSCDRNVMAYVVTGVVPDHTIKLKGKVTVSKYYWRATCCQKNGVYTGKAYFGPDNNDVLNESLSITALQTQLATDYGVNAIVIFPGVPPPQGAQVDPCN